MRYALWITYDGTAYCGWQIQPNGISVQQKIQEALSILYKKDCSITGSGRTDAGVHAYQQIAHFDSEDTIDSFRMQRSLNGLLPTDIRILGIFKVADDFHARYDAQYRYYRYRIALCPVVLERGFRWEIRPKPDIERMNLAAELLLGTHDFGSFCLAKSEIPHKICTLSQAIFLPDETPHHYTFHIKGNRFLHGMVRAIVGTLVEIGQGKRKVEDMSAILAAQNRRAAGTAAPAKGLCLYEVHYQQLF